MNITKENIDDLNAIVKLSIEKSDYETTVDENLKEYRKKASIPGFRPGKAPMGFIKKKYGKAVVADEVNKILSKELTSYIVDNDLNILGEPLPNEEKQPVIDWDKDENFEFVFDIGMSPEIELVLDKQTKLPYYEIKVDDDLIDKEIEIYSNRFGKNIEAGEVVEKGSVKGDFVQVDEDGNEVEGGVSAENALVSVEMIKDEAIKENFIGAKKGDVITFNIKTAFDNEHQIASVLDIGHSEVAKLDCDFRLTINEVYQFEAAEVDVELFKKVYGDNTEIENVDDFREKVSGGIRENLKYSSDYKLFLDIKATLSENAKIKLPEEFLKRWLRATNKNLTDEQLAGDFDNFTKDLEWTLIKDKIANENDIKVSDDDIRNAAREMVAMQFRQYGISELQEEHVETYVNSILKKEKERRRLSEKKIEDKVVAFVREKVDIELKEVTREEFDKLLEQN